MTQPVRGRPPATDRRAQIVRAARAVMAERGYAQASLKQIATEAGIAQGLLSYYYPAKDDLLVDVVADIDAELNARWVAAVAAAGTPLDRINAGFDQAIQDCLDRPEFFRLLFDQLAVASTNDAVRARTAELLDNFIALVATEIEQVETTLPSPLPPGIDLAGALAGAFTGILVHSVTRGTDPAAAFDALRAMVVALATMSYVQAGETPGTTTVTPRRQ